MASSSTTDGMGNAVPERPEPPPHPAPLRDEQPTVISSRPPLSRESDATEAYRLGRVSPGDQLGHFEIIEFVGGGGMARVYRAMDLRLARPVALKVLSLEQASDPETKQRFHKEAQSAARLDHENIARVFYVGEDRGLPFIVFEYIEGTDVRALVEQKGVLPLAEAVSYTLQIAEALAHAAAHNVVHRDIKPSNVLITPGGQAKVIDMGLARMHRADGPGSDLTASGVTLGTFDYISPEQARDPRNADVRSDIYSLGCTFFFMLAGRPPFPEGTVLQKLLKHQGDEPPDLRHFRPNLPEEAVRVARRMLAKDPRRRYQNASELVEDLLTLAEQVGLRPLGPGRTVWVVPREPHISFLQRHLPWVAPIAALLGIVLFLHFLWSSPAGPPEDVPPMVLDTPSDPPDPIPEIPPETPETPGKAALDPPKLPTGGTPGPGDASALPEPKPSDPPTAEKPAGATDSSSGQGANTASTAGAETNVPSPGGTPATTPTAKPDSGGVQPAPFAGGVSGTEAVASGVSVVAPVASNTAEGSATGGTVAVDSPTPTDRPSPQPGVLVVSDSPTGAGQFATLAAACNAVESGDVIELRYSGRRDTTPETPIRMANMRLTVRAGQGFAPVVVFRPTADDTDPVKYPRSMFGITGGELTLYDLAVELTVPREVPAENWSMFEPSQGATLRLKQCSLTIRNASDRQTSYHADAAFVRCSAPPGADMVTADEAAGPTPPVSVELTDCVARGEAVFLRPEDVQPVRLTWNNGLLATTERLLVADGGQRLPVAGEKIELDLQHLTAVVSQGLCLLRSSHLAPYQLDTQVRCRDSILMADTESSLIEQVGLDSTEAMKQRFQWNGDWNFYEGFTVFWNIHSDDPDSLPEILTLDGWQAHWSSQRESMPKWGQVVWKNLPAATKPMHTRTQDDYALGDSISGNPARGAARDGRDVGLQSELLPQPPAEQPAPAAATESAPTDSLQ